MQDNQAFEPPPAAEASKPAVSDPSRMLNEAFVASQHDLQAAMQRAILGVGTLLHELDETVVFMLDNHEEVRLRVRKIEIAHANDQVLDLKVFCRTDFENVLILARKLNMRISAFSTWFTVVLTGEPEFTETWTEAILGMKHPSLFFETLDELKRPIFLNLNHYIISRISD